MEDLINVFAISFRTLMNLLPWIIVGVLVSEAMKYFKWAEFISKAPKRSPILATLFAVALGILSPLCTYSTIPIVVTMFRLGFPLQPLITFLVASSVMNPQLFLLTWGGINPELALVRLALSLLFSLIFGLLILNINPDWIVNPVVRESAKEYRMKERLFSWTTFLRNSVESLQFIGFYIVIGILLGAFIEVYVPVDWFLFIFQSKDWIGVLIGAILGVPLYVCGGGTIPLINSMLMNGMSVGAAIAFFLVGPATRVTPLLALAAIIRPAFILFYVAVLILFAVGAGLLYGMF
jgi:uncharacterized membrane protein YraQ (UPF0718 family)